MANNGVTWCDFSGVDGGGFLWKEACQGGVFGGLDEGVKVLDGVVVVGDDVGNYYMQPIVSLILLLNI